MGTMQDTDDNRMHNKNRKLRGAINEDSFQNQLANKTNINTDKSK